MMRTRSGKNTSNGGKLHSVIRQTPTILNNLHARTLAMLMATSKNLRNRVRKNKPSQNKLNNAKRFEANIRRIHTSTKPFHGYRELNRSNVKEGIHLAKHGKLNNNNAYVSKHGARYNIGHTRMYHLIRAGMNLNELKKKNKTNIGRNNNNDIIFTNARDPRVSYTLEKEYGRLYKRRPGQSHMYMTGVKPKNIFSNANLAKVLP